MAALRFNLLMNIYLPDDEHYLLRNPHHESYQTVNLEPKPKERASRVSEHLPIIPVRCGGGIASLAVSKTTSGVVLNNERSYDQKRNYMKTCIMKH